MKKEIDITELQQSIRLNYARLDEGEYYRIEEVFSPADYDWQADKEGRALLAFVSHYKINGKKIPCMEQMIQLLPSKLNEKGYFGPRYTPVIHEQQLSGHSWLLRGLCEYYEQFEGRGILDIIMDIVNNLYLPLKGKFGGYPIDRKTENVGDVSGTSSETENGWILSSDIGCAFMSIDGLSHVFEITKDDRIKALLDEMIEVYLRIDKVSLKVQTHCTLSAARGMMQMYHSTGDEKYKDGAKAIYDLYVFGGGITYTYHNLNWWGRPDTWSEPCAIVDSVMLATELFKVTGDEVYRTMAARIYHNAFSSMQRSNGGAGTDTLVCEKSPWIYLGIQMYEAYFCCTMRLAEGLWYVYENRNLLYAEFSNHIIKNENNIYTDGDIVYCEVDKEFLKYAEEIIEHDGHTLCPIVKIRKVPEADAKRLKMQIVF